MMIRKLLPLLLALCLTGCAGKSTAGHSPQAEENAIEFFAMDTVMTIRAWGAEDALLARARDLAEELEAQLSATDPDSAVYALNRTGAAELSPDAAELLRRALELCAETEGALDISVYPVVRAWGFTASDGQYRVPGEAELRKLVENVDYRRVSLEKRSASLPEGMEIDLGAVAKGYTGDRIAQLLRQSGVEHALLDLGGNIQTVGTRPDGTDWRIAVQDPRGDGILGVLAVSDKAVITSGGYERYFEDEDGRVWWHIMDPSTGYPARNGLISVTVVGDEGVFCDALSTALFILGPEKALDFWRDRGGFDLVLVTEGGEALLTPGLKDRFKPQEGSGYTFATVS